MTGNFLSHYTSFQGLVGMVRTQSFRATQFHLLNDSSEMMYAFQILIKDAFDTFLKMLPDKTLIRKDLEESYAEMQSRKYAEEFGKLLVTESGYGSFYFVSFARGRNDDENDRGILTLWDRYTRFSGFCLQYDENDLRQKLLREQELYSYEYINYAEVKYGVDKTSPVFKHLLETFSNMMLIQAANEFGRPDLKPDDFNTPPMHVLANELFPFCATHKDPQFVDERETRIIVSPSNKAVLNGLNGIKQTKPIQNRGTSESAIRYLTICDASFPGLSPKRILIGPKTSSIEQNLMMHLWQSPPQIVKANIPIR